MAENKVAAMYQKKQATAQQAEAVIDALMKVFDQPPFDWEPPRVMVDTWEQGRTVVVWEEGPHGWMWVFPCGGMLDGTLWEVPEAALPKGVCVEPNDGCVVSIYQEVAELQRAESRKKRFASAASSTWMPRFGNGRIFARQLAAQHSRPTRISTGQHGVQLLGTPKMPAEPKRVQPSGDTELKKGKKRA